MNPNDVSSAIIAFRNQIEVAYGTSCYWKEWIEQGNRLFDRNRGVDVTDECLVEINRRCSLARMILDAPPLNILFLVPNSDMSDDDED